MDGSSSRWPTAGSVCCVALGTRGDVQPLACLALHLQRTRPQIVLSFITHAAHSLWLEQGPYSHLSRKEYLTSPPAGGVWSPPAGPHGSAPDGPAAPGAVAFAVSEVAAPATAASAAASAPKPSAAGPGAGGPTAAATTGFAGAEPPVAATAAYAGDPLAQPDSQVVVAVVRCLLQPRAGAAGVARTGPSDPRDSSDRDYPTEIKPQHQGQPPAQGPAEEHVQRLVLDAEQLLSLPVREVLRQLRPTTGEAARQPPPPEGDGPAVGGFAASAGEAAAAGSRLEVFNRFVGNGSSGGSSGSIGTGAAASPVGICRPALVLFNLFALEAYHAAEALRLPCAVAAPYMMPYRCPAAFHRMFRRELPELYDTLQCHSAAGAEVAAAGGSSGSDTTAARVTYAEVEHWMWPLFTERWGDWRQRELGLPPLPLHDPQGDGDRPLTPEQLPPAPPLLYGFSEVVVPRPAFWPPSVKVCGFWQPPVDWFRHQSLTLELSRILVSGTRFGLPEDATTLAQSAGPRDAAADTAAGDTFPADNNTAASHVNNDCSDRCRPMGRCNAHEAGPGPSSPLPARAFGVVDFGSSGLLGLIPRPLYTLGLLEAAARRVGIDLVVLTAGWQPLHEAWQELQRHRSTSGPEVGEESPQAAAEEPSLCGGPGPGSQPSPLSLLTSPAESESLPAPAHLSVCCLAPARQQHAAGADERPLGGVPAAKRRRVDGEHQHESGGALQVGQTADGDPEEQQRAHEGDGGSRSAHPSQPDRTLYRLVGLSSPPPGPLGMRVHLYSGDVPHQLLLPYCQFVLHHAGSGTTAAALQCGVPQVTCPLHFDQPFWAERVAHLDLSPPPLPRELLFGALTSSRSRGLSQEADPHVYLDEADERVSALAAAFRDVMQPARREIARAMARELAKEDGLEVAARVLQAALLGRVTLRSPIVVQKTDC